MLNVESEESVVSLFQDLNPGEIIDVSERKEVLEGLLRVTKSKAQDILEALKKDLGRHYHESCLIELFPTVGDIKHTISKINKWTKPDSVKTPASVFPSKIKIDKTPLGKGLIISPFNFPFFLSLPYVSTAIAAGNVVVVRSSNKTPNCSQVLYDIAREVDRPHIFKVVSCSHDIADKLTCMPWDKVFYTGSTEIGKHIAKLTSNNLVPLTLELGGKSPTIVTKNCDIELASKRIAFGKSINCGQICVSPDYVLIEHNDECQDLTSQFIREYTKHINTFYDNDPKKSSSFSRIISSDACARLKKMIKEAELAQSEFCSSHGSSNEMGADEKVIQADSKQDEESGTTSIESSHKSKKADIEKSNILVCSTKTQVFLGRSSDVDEESRYVPPTIILNPNMEMQCMKEEIFGPVLVIIEMFSLKDMLEFISLRPRPLALYAFTDDKDEMAIIRRDTRSGDLLFNDTVLHCMLSECPFGGVGNSGMGVAHGYQAFLSWCTLRTIMERNAHGGLSQFDKLFRYAPYEETYQKALGVISAGWSFDWKEVDPEGGAGVGASEEVVRETDSSSD